MVGVDLRFVGRFRNRDGLARRCTWKQVFKNDRIEVLFEIVRRKKKSLNSINDKRMIGLVG
jgi:fructosamine-3-kinase